MRIFVSLGLPILSIILGVAVVLSVNAYHPLDLVQAVLVFAACFCILLVLKIHLAQQFWRSKVLQDLSGVETYEKQIGERISSLAARVDNDQALAEVYEHLGSIEAQLERHNALLASGFSSDYSKIPGSSGGVDDIAEQLESNVVPLNPSPYRSDQLRDGKFGVPRDLNKCLDNGQLVMHLQPMLSLLDRTVVGYEAFARLELDAGRIIPAASFISRAEKTGCIADIDHRMLFKIVRLIRELDRDAINPVFHWNLSGLCIADHLAFHAFENVLKANVAICKQITAEISQKTYADLETLGLRRLSTLRELGVNLSIDNCKDVDLTQKAISSGLFSDVKIPTNSLIGYNDETIEHVGSNLSNIASDRQVRLIATEVEREFQVMELIDQDILFGQGNLFMEPKPAKSQPNAPKLASIS